MVKIRVCKKCGWKDEKVKRELKRLAKKHGDDVDVQKKKCLDACKKGRAVRVGKNKKCPRVACPATRGPRIGAGG